MAEKEFPEIKEKNKGKFTAWAKQNGFKDDRYVKLGL